MGLCCYCCLCWFGDCWRWVPLLSATNVGDSVKSQCSELWAGCFPSPKARREGKTCRLEKPQSRNTESGVAARSGCKCRQHSPVDAAVPTDWERRESNARGETLPRRGCWGPGPRGAGDVG